jgi:hypothetical protein
MNGYLMKHIGYGDISQSADWKAIAFDLTGSTGPINTDLDDVVISKILSAEQSNKVSVFSSHADNLLDGSDIVQINGKWRAIAFDPKKTYPPLTRVFYEKLQP